MTIKEKILDALGDQSLSAMELARAIDEVEVVEHTTPEFKEALWQLSGDHEVEFDWKWRIKKAGGSRL